MGTKKSALSQIFGGFVIFLVGAGSIIVLLVIVIPGLLWLINGRDIKPIDDSFLQLSVVNLPDNENGFYDLEKIDSLVDLKSLSKKRELAVDFLNSEKWESEEVKTLLDDNEAVLKLFPSAAGKKSFQTPFTANPESISADMPVVSLNPWRQASQLSVVKALDLAKSGHYDEAVDEAMKSIAVGNSIEDSQCILITYLVGVSIKKNGIDALQKIISMTPKKSLNQAYSEKLSSYKAKGNKAPFSIEYMMCKKAINSTDLKGDLGELDNMISKNGFYFKRNATTAYCFNIYNKLAIEANKNCRDVKEVPDPRPILKEASLFKWYFTENLLGKRMADNLVIDLNSVLRKKCDNETRLEEMIFATGR